MSASLQNVLSTYGMAFPHSYGVTRVHSMAGVPSTHTSDTLFAKAADAITGVSQAVAQRGVKVAYWTDLSVLVSIGAGGFGRSITVVVAFGDSTEPAPTTINETLSLPRSSLFRFGGESDPPLDARTKTADFAAGEFSSIIKLGASVPFGKPVLYVWVQHAASESALTGDMLLLEFIGSFEMYGSHPTI